MDEPKIRRRRRRRSDTEKLSITSNKSIQPNELRDINSQVTNDLTYSSIESLSETVKQNSDNNQSQPQMDISSTVDKQSINSIRAELLEDKYHSDLAESDYSNDTHDWGEHGFEYSDEYWNFLGRFE